MASVVSSGAKSMVEDKGQEFQELLVKVKKNDDSLKKISLQSYEIGDAGAKALAAALEKNTTVIEIDLRKNKIGAAGAKALAAVLKANRTVIKIDLRKNKIGAAGAKAIAGALKTNSTVEELCLGGNKIGDAGGKALADALRANSTVTLLDLGENDIGDASGKALFQALELNVTIKVLHLLYHNNNITGPLLNQIYHQLDVNTNTDGRYDKSYQAKCDNISNTLLEERKESASTVPENKSFAKRVGNSQAGYIHPNP